MDEVINKESRPVSAYTLFVKLYCKKKLKPSTKHNSNVEEAAKAWLLLSTNERQIFIDKYEEYRKKELASYLKKAEPYLKRKKIQEFHFEDKSFGSELYVHNKTEDVPNSVPDFAQYNPQDTSIHPEINTHICEEENDTVKNILSEPTPPSVKTAKDLYNLINTDVAADWASIPDLKKRRYQRAVLALKKDYINKYKKYLDSLSSKDLYEHYCDKIDCDI